MTVEAMSSLPLQATSALASAAGRLALAGLQLYMRAPLRNTGMTALVLLSAMAGSNLLYGQAHHHPAPLFGSFAAKTETAQVTPISKPKKLAKVTSSETTGAISPAAPKAATVGNDDVKAVQQQLKAMNLFTGTVDGLFGPRTSKAIKAFEAQLGRPQRGQLTPEIVALIKGAQLPAAPIAPKAAVAPAAAPAPVELAVVAAPKQEAAASTPLPSPAPLAATVASAPEAVATEDTTGSTGTATLEMNAAPTVIKKSVQTIAVRAKTAPAPESVAQEMPAPLEVATAETDTTTVAQEMAEPQPDATAVAMAEAPVSTTADPAMDKKVVTAVQRGLNSLGFLHGEITGEADEATAKAIRNFEVYYNYAVTGRVTQKLVKMLIQAGGVI